VLQRMIGKNGIDIWKKANGIDNNPQEPYTERNQFRPNILLIRIPSTFKNWNRYL
jgi:hypothetical protein